MVNIPPSGTCVCVPSGAIQGLPTSYALCPTYTTSGGIDNGSVSIYQTPTPICSTFGAVLIKTVPFSSPSTVEVSDITLYAQTGGGDLEQLLNDIVNDIGDALKSVGYNGGHQVIDSQAIGNTLAIHITFDSPPALIVILAICVVIAIIAYLTIEALQIIQNIIPNPATVGGQVLWIGIAVALIVSGTAFAYAYFSGRPLTKALTG